MPNRWLGRAAIPWAASGGPGAAPAATEEAPLPA